VPDNNALFLDALDSAALDIETIGRLTRYIQRPVDVGVKDGDKAVRTTRQVALLRLKRTVDALVQLEAEGKI
jgi:hypothetical protein